MSKSRHFLYQPSMLDIIIIWSWALIILFLGIIFWLEVTHYQWITSFFFILFAFVTFSQISFRRITIQNNQMIIGKVLNPKWIVTDLNHVKINYAKRNLLSFHINHKNLSLTLSANSVIELETIINHHKINKGESN